MDNMIGIRLREKRTEFNMTPTKVKELIGISSGHLSELETGKKLPSTPTLIKFSELYQCSVDWILFGKTLNSDSPCNLSSLETTCNSLFMQLEFKDQCEIIEIIKLKLELSNHGKKLSSSNQKNSIFTA